MARDRTQRSELVVGVLDEVIAPGLRIGKGLKNLRIGHFWLGIQEGRWKMAAVSSIFLLRSSIGDVAR
jgi:hypothetical protein